MKSTNILTVKCQLSRHEDIESVASFNRWDADVQTLNPECGLLITKCNLYAYIFFNIFENWDNDVI